MLGRMYESQTCSVARTLEVVGERWSLLIIRDAIFARTTRFQDFQRRLSVAPNILKARLDTFLQTEVMVRRRYSEHPEHYEYVLTQKGLDLYPIIVALASWGDRYAAPDGSPVIFEHAVCANPIELRVRCPRCGDIHSPEEITAQPGPGLPADASFEITADTR
jgi:DNA-binding HxlR family transcriptional regulator